MWAGCARRGGAHLREARVFVPSKSQLRWSQLRVGITVLVSVSALVVLIFLMSNTAGLFTKRITLYTYVDNASGLRVGAPVRLQGVDVGNVTEIKIIHGHGVTPVRLMMRISLKEGVKGFIKKDTTATLGTAGVLGETFVDLDSAFAKDPNDVADGDTLLSRDVPDIQDVVRSTQSSLQNVNALINRADNILSIVENGKGTIGKLIYDPQLYANTNSAISQLNDILMDLNQGHGSIGKLLKDEEFYGKLNQTVDHVNATVEAVNRGEGSAGKFIKDPALYDNTNRAVSQLNQLLAAVNSGDGTLGKLAKDPEMARKLDQTITNLNLISTRLANGEGSAGKFLKDPAFYNDTDALLNESRSLVKAIRSDPKKFLTIRLKMF
jgi:phospholipid/cholesterol/gamma-HCH transport system substrate-binding protein